MDGALWVMSGPGIPCGARKTEVMGPAVRGRVWLDVCIMGQHLPQMYRLGEASELTAGQCPQLGLCTTCYGFGDLGQPAAEAFTLARGIDEVGNPCPACAGSGRPALRVTVTRDGSGVQGEIRALPHAYVPPEGFNAELEAMFGGTPAAEVRAMFEVTADMCLACGMPRDGKGPHGEALHQAEA